MQEQCQENSYCNHGNCILTIYSELLEKSAQENFRTNRKITKLIKIHDRELAEKDTEIFKLKYRLFQMENAELKKINVNFSNGKKKIRR